MPNVLITAPSVEPIDLATARAQCRISDTVEDALLAIWITTARRQAESRTGRALINQGWAQLCTGFPAGDEPLALRMAPLVSVDEITYTDPAGAAQTLAGAAVEVDTASVRGQVRPIVNTTWPATLQRGHAVRVEYTAGYGDEPTDVPAEIRSWMLLTIAYLHEQRSAADTTGRHTVLPGRFHDALLDAYIVYGC